MPETFWWDTLSNSVAGVVGGLIVVAIAGFLVRRTTHFEGTKEDDYESFQGPASKWYTLAAVLCFLTLFIYVSTWHPAWLVVTIVLGVVTLALMLRFFLTTLAWQLAGPIRRRSAERDAARAEFFERVYRSEAQDRSADPVSRWDGLRKPNAE